MLPRLLYGPIFHLDANLINARQELDPINSMERWRDDGVILLAMAGIAHEEARAGKGGNVEERKRKAARHLYTIKSDEPVRADDTYSRVEKILWGEATNQNQANDVEVVCEAILWSAILVTRDGGSKTQRNGILGRKRYVLFTADVRDYQLYGSGNSCLLDVPRNQKGALKRFAGKQIRLVCGGKSNRYSGRYYFAKPVNG
jgi:hypothetical protein